jgi:hypothetical protein
MTTVSFRIGEVLTDVYPPDKVCADIRDGMATILKIDHPDETIGDLLELASRMREVRHKRNQKLARKSRVG